MAGTQFAVRAVQIRFETMRDDIQRSQKNINTLERELKAFERRQVATGRAATGAGRAVADAYGRDAQRSVSRTRGEVERLTQSINRSTSALEDYERRYRRISDHVRANEPE